MGAAKKIKSNDSPPADNAALEELSFAEHDEQEGHDPFSGGHKKVEEGEGPWLVSYADLMTLLMGFFALIASFSKPDQQEFEKVQKAATEYFGGEYEEPYKDLEKALEKVIKENKIEDQVKIDASFGGVTITFTGTFFFDSGDFKVKENAKPVLDQMIKAIKSQAKEYNSTIEGHTDIRPINHPIIASNWELSGLRAARIAQRFEERGFAKNQLTIMGWGETKPLAPNYNPDGSINEENQARNRRVVIKLFKPL